MIHLGFQCPKVLTFVAEIMQVKTDVWINKCEIFDLALADLGGIAPARAPPRVPILSFWHTNLLLRGPRPPYGKSWIRLCLGWYIVSVIVEYKLNSFNLILIINFIISKHVLIELLLARTTIIYEYKTHCLRFTF